MIDGNTIRITVLLFFFFFNDTATTEIYTLSLHDALPIYRQAGQHEGVLHGGTEHGRERPWLAEQAVPVVAPGPQPDRVRRRDRKSTRLNSSHANISYAVFCLKKKKNENQKIH